MSLKKRKFGLHVRLSYAKDGKYVCSSPFFLFRDELKGKSEKTKIAWQKREQHEQLNFKFLKIMFTKFQQVFIKIEHKKIQNDNFEKRCLEENQ